MTHIDLFSGIGGFAYAAWQVWPDYRNLFFCDNNKFCQAIIRKNFGAGSLIYSDIREVTVERFIADTEKCGLEKYGVCERPTIIKNNIGVIADTESIDNIKNKSGLRGEFERYTEWQQGADLLTGGFPCQPFSAAGKRKGRDDDRHLWPEMFRVIKEFRPRWVIAENVRGLINIENGMAFEQACLDLESVGYTVQAYIIPACAVNAPHRRDRVWIVANLTGTGLQEQQYRPKQKQAAKTKNGTGMDNRFERSDCYAADADNRQRPRATSALLQGQDRETSDRPSGRDNNAADAASRRGKEICQDIQPGQPNGIEPNPDSWRNNWLEVATRLCRVDDGLPAGVDGFKLSKSKHREERLKALGNAIVPQVVVPIMEAIKNDL